jgi:hypothetical protein
MNLLVKEYIGARFSAHSLQVSFIIMARLAGQNNESIKKPDQTKTDAIISQCSHLDNVIKYNVGHALGL